MRIAMALRDGRAMQAWEEHGGACFMGDMGDLHCSLLPPFQAWHVVTWWTSEQ